MRTFRQLLLLAACLLTGTLASTVSGGYVSSHTAGTDGVHKGGYQPQCGAPVHRSQLPAHNGPEKNNGNFRYRHLEPPIAQPVRIGYVRLYNQHTGQFVTLEYIK